MSNFTEVVDLLPQHCIQQNAAEEFLDEIQNRLPQRSGEQIVDVNALQSSEEIVEVIMLIPHTRT